MFVNKYLRYSKTTRLPRTQYPFSKGQSTITEEVHLQVFHTVSFVNQLSNSKCKALYFYSDIRVHFGPVTYEILLKVFRVRSQRQVIDEREDVSLRVLVNRNPVCV